LCNLFFIFMQVRLTISLSTFFGRIRNEINVMFVILYKVVVKNCPM
jgi:hypothetical protein